MTRSRSECPTEVTWQPCPLVAPHTYRYTWTAEDLQRGEYLFQGDRRTIRAGWHFEWVDYNAPAGPIHA